MDSRITRRTFVQTSCAAASLAAVNMLRPRRATAQQLPATMGNSSLSPYALLQPPIAPADLRSLATGAVEAATHAGATYADVRVGEQHKLLLGWDRRAELSVYIESRFTYGIRALVDGAWAFTHGSEPTTDAVVTSARDAVTMARAYGPFVVHRAELAPTPVVTGEWSTPVKIDPFAVPLRDHHAMLDSYDQLRRRVQQPKTYLAATRCNWTRETRVFASSEGTLTLQQLRNVEPGMGARVSCPGASVALRFLPWAAASGGYELVADPTRYEEAFLALVETTARYGMLPERTLDVGRYPVAFDGGSTGVVLGHTIGPALELDRVLGEEADASGTSYLGPPLEMLGTTIANPQLSITATRAMPAFCAVQWDDEGVAPHDYPVITGGRLVDYHTTRWTAPALASWYTQQGQPLRSHGCATVAETSEPLAVRAPLLRMAPAPSSASVEALCKDIKEGLLVTGIDAYHTDQQFASGEIAGKDMEAGVILKIARGKIVGRITGNGLEMSTKRFWKEQLVTLGDASTVQQKDLEVTKGMPWRSAWQSVSAPAALFKDVNVVAYPGR